MRSLLADTTKDAGNDHDDFRCPLNLFPINAFHLTPRWACGEGRQMLPFHVNLLAFQGFPVAAGEPFPLPFRRLCAVDVLGNRPRQLPGGDKNRPHGSLLSFGGDHRTSPVALGSNRGRPSPALPTPRDDAPDDPDDRLGRDGGIVDDHSPGLQFGDSRPRSKPLRTARSCLRSMRSISGGRATAPDGLQPLLWPTGQRQWQSGGKGPEANCICLILLLVSRKAYLYVLTLF